MPAEKLVVGPINKGFKADRTAFVIDNDSFPTLINSYQWRGRVKRKRGTALLTRLTRGVLSINSGQQQPTDNPITYLDGAGNTAAPVNLITVFSLETNSTITPGSITFSDGVNTYTEPAIPDGTLIGAPGGSGTLDYSTGIITITGGNPNAALIGTFSYYPSLPVMGLEDFKIVDSAPIGTMGFDTTYAYQFDTSTDTNHSVSYYKNPLTSATLPGYVPKTFWTPVTWTGGDAKQFWTCNYQSAFWAVNNKPGMHFQKASATVAGAPTTTVVFTVVNPVYLVPGDFVFAYGFTAATFANSNSLNGQAGYVTIVAGVNVTVVFPKAKVQVDTYTGGILQMLTNTNPAFGDGIRWYDGDPTNAGALPPTLPFGWVNFAPPISSFTLDGYTVGNNPAAQYYLCGAKMVIPFKGRLLFLGPYITTKDTTPGNEIYLQDTIFASEDGTVFYTESFDYTVVPFGSGTTAKPNMPILVADNETASPKAFWVDIPGFGFYISAGTQAPIQTANPEKDVLIIGFNNRFAQFSYTGNDLLPFSFYSINVEWGASSTFSSITTDRGAITIGNYGLTMTGIDASTRIDLEIPDQIFQINPTNHGVDRICSQRDYINEWIYFTYPSNDYNYFGDIPKTFPTQTLQFNYRDNSWALFNETYTTYGAYRTNSQLTWNKLNKIDWDSWNTPWDSGVSSEGAPLVIAGNTEGFVMNRSVVDTDEGTSLFIKSFNSIPNTLTIPDHCLNDGDYIQISGCLGTVSVVNGRIFSVKNINKDTISLIDPTTPFIIGSLTYLGLGLVTRFYVPFIQTKQFPASWGMSRKTRIGTQQYLFSNNPNGQATVYIYLSQDASNAYNFGTVVPDPASLNNALIYSSVVFTGAETFSASLFNNIQNPIAASQAQIWHRMNTSLIGDSVQVAITLSDAEMRDTTPGLPNQTGELELHSFIFDVYPSQILA